jgi:hypothetical protein
MAGLLHDKSLLRFSRLLLLGMCKGSCKPLLLIQGRAKELLCNKRNAVRRQTFVLQQSQLLELPPSPTTVQ